MYNEYLTYYYTGGFTGSFLRYRAVCGFGGSSYEREEQLVSGAEVAAREGAGKEGPSEARSASSRMWCRDAFGGCDFRADVAVWDDIGSFIHVWRLRGLELEPDMILV